MAKRRGEAQVLGRPPAARTDKVAAPDTKDGLWFIVTRDLERNAVRYLPVNHHLVISGKCPDRVPSMGAKAKTPGDNYVPVDKSGSINLADAAPGEIYSLLANGTIKVIRMTDKLRKLIADGKEQSSSFVPALIPPMMHRPRTLGDQYEQATNVPLTAEGMQHRALAEHTLPNPLA